MCEVPQVGKSESIVGLVLPQSELRAGTFKPWNNPANERIELYTQRAIDL